MARSPAARCEPQDSDPGRHITLGANETLQDYMRQHFPEQMTNAPAPVLILPPAAATVLGTSHLSPDGVQN